MSTDPIEFTDTIPYYYDRGLGPNMFEAYAADLARVGCEEAVLDALEVAAGTGIVSRHLRNRLPAAASLISTDFNPQMLEIAKRKFSDEERVEFKVANAMVLPFEDGLFDLVICQFGVMFFPDKCAFFREANRVLKPGGRMVFNVWSAMSENPFSQLAKDVASDYFPDNPPEFYDTPFRYGDPVDVTSDLLTGGWLDIQHETLRITQVIVDPRGYAEGLVYGNPLIHEIRARKDLDPEEVVSKMCAAIKLWFGQTDMTMPLSATRFVCRKS
ncbi:MAG: class I SAM-dependent methyltransferase [Pseudoruegeria sp.]